MKQIYIANIAINSVRYLKDININLSEDKKMNLIITGANGSGKTSLLTALSNYLKDLMDDLPSDNLQVTFNLEKEDIYKNYQKGNFLMAYYKAYRTFEPEKVKNIEKIHLNDKYAIDEKSNIKFMKYLVDLKVTQALALTSNKKEKANQIEMWFQSFENLLKNIFDESSLKLEFDEDQFRFYIKIGNKGTFDFNNLSDGYAAILDIVSDIIMRMEKYTNRRFEYSLPGIVLIDEIEAHLHVKLQKRIFQLLTSIFPNIQFIITTNSPFVVNSIDAIVCDL